MKIAILTQPLHNNYGGLLQAFALQYYLKSLGHDVLTVDFAIEERKTGYRTLLKYCLKSFLFILGKKKKRLDENCSRIIGQNTKRFVSENIRTTQPIRSISDLKLLTNYNFDAYIVGSDQVWRPLYSPYIPAFFLSFVSEHPNIIRASYAASFGIDSCEEFNQDMIEKCSTLLKNFDAVSVREDSAVDLCKSCFGVNAIQVIDPTLLLEKEVYIGLVEKDLTKKSEGNLMVYLLDESKDKEIIIQSVSDKLKLITFKISKDIDGVYPAVTRWIRGFMDAEFVVTDSFHGVVFSLIFRKQFLAIGNKDRGLARFTSILKLFQLEDRLIFSANQSIDEIIDKKINYDDIDKLKRLKKEQGELFITNVLKEQ